MKGAPFFRSAKELAYLALYLALLIGGQYLFAAVPGVEIVTLLFVTYSFSFGVQRGIVLATCFSFLRQILFGFFPKVLILYLVYFNLLAVVFALLGKAAKKRQKTRLWLVTLIACLCTAFFTVLDALLTAWYFAFTAQAAKTYFLASLPFMLPQIVCTGVTVGGLFLPLRAIFDRLNPKE